MHSVPLRGYLTNWLLVPKWACNGGSSRQGSWYLRKLSYAGGQFFNFFGLGKRDMKELQTKEIKNGRLAM